MHKWNNLRTFVVEKGDNMFNLIHMRMLAQVKPENGKYMVQVYRANSIVDHCTWQTIAETKDQSLAIELREYCRYGNHSSKIAAMRANYLATHKK